jgi:hypothetical protein
MKIAILAVLSHLGAVLDTAEPLSKITASFYAFGYVPGYEKVHIMTGLEVYQEIQLSKANIVGPVKAVGVNGTLRICDKPVSVSAPSIKLLPPTATFPNGLLKLTVAGVVPLVVAV